METNSQIYKGLKFQIEEAYGRVLYTYTTHLKDANLLIIKSKKLKCFQIILSAITTGGLLTSLFSDSNVATILTTIISCLLLFLNLYFKNFDFEKDISLHIASANDLWLIKEQYISVLTDYDNLDYSVLRKKRNDLQEKTSKIYSTSIKTSDRAYSLAQDALKNKEEQYFSTDELNQMLPEHLRKN